MQAILRRCIICLQIEQPIEVEIRSSNQQSNSRRQSFSYQTLTSKRDTATSYEISHSYDTSPSYETSADLRVGAFNVRVFGRSKVANDDVLNILVKVIRSWTFTDILNLCSVCKDFVSSALFVFGSFDTW